MAHTKLPSPSQVRGVDADLLESARLRLKSALSRSGGKEFTYAASAFPRGTTDILLGELFAAGWKHRFTSDWRDGDFYTISPR